MATLKQRVHRMNSSGAYDVIHYETEAGLVLYTNNSQSTVSGALDKLFTDMSGKANSSHNHAGSAITSGTVAAARLGTMTGATSSAAGASGAVPAPAKGAATRYLRSDGTWQVPPDTNTTYTAASANPKMDGTVAVGTSAKYAREDHVHPVDTSRAAASHNHAASNITSGTLAVARGGTGGADVTAAANSLQVASLGNGTAIPNTADLNTYTTLGNYHCAQTVDARKIKHVPGFNTSTLLNTSFSAFTMKVGYGTGTGYPCQTIIQYDTGVRYYRVQSNGTWGDWKEFAQNTNTTYSNFVKSGSSAKAGLVPSPGTTAGTTKYLREDATWVVPPDTKYTHPSYTAKSAGLYKVTVDATGHVSAATAVTKADITALGIPGSDTNTTYSTFVKSGSSAAAGLVPKPSTTAGTTKYLREDATWVVPPNTTYSNMTAATASAAGKAGLVPAPAAGKQTSFLRGDGTWVIPTNTTYSAGTGISLSDTTFSNSGVRSIATGSSNGTISVNTNGTSANVAVKGLGSAAYTASTAYATASHTHAAATSSAAGLMSAIAHNILSCGAGTAADGNWYVTDKTTLTYNSTRKYYYVTRGLNATDLTIESPTSTARGWKVILFKAYYNSTRIVFGISIDGSDACIHGTDGSNAQIYGVYANITIEPNFSSGSTSCPFGVYINNGKLYPYISDTLYSGFSKFSGSCLVLYGADLESYKYS